eukprot:365360-Chlamydomonas_euryale.AAC.1
MAMFCRSGRARSITALWPLRIGRTSDTAVFLAISCRLFQSDVPSRPSLGLGAHSTAAECFQGCDGGSATLTYMGAHAWHQSAAPVAALWSKWKDPSWQLAGVAACRETGSLV